MYSKVYARLLQHMAKPQRCRSYLAPAAKDLLQSGQRPQEGHDNGDVIGRAARQRLRRKPPRAHSRVFNCVQACRALSALSCLHTGRCSAMKPAEVSSTTVQQDVRQPVSDGMHTQMRELMSCTCLHGTTLETP